MHSTNKDAFPGIDEPASVGTSDSINYCAILNKLFNQFLENRQIEIDFARAIGIFIPKKGSSFSAENMRLICVLNTDNKLLTKTIMRRIEPIIQFITE